MLVLVHVVSVYRCCVIRDLVGEEREIYGVCCTI
jgi:hypothetical protein